MTKLTVAIWWIPVPTVHKLRLTKCCESSYFTLCCIVPQRLDWLMVLTEINKVVLQCVEKNKLPFPACRSYSNSIQVTWRTQLGCDAVFMTSSPSGSLRFLLIAVIFRTVTFRRFQLQLWKSLFCRGISFHLFIFTYSPNWRVSDSSPLAYRRVHEGKPRAMNRSRVNPMRIWQQWSVKCVNVEFCFVPGHVTFCNRLRHGPKFVSRFGKNPK